jgi:hypothetical protein
MRNIKVRIAWALREIRGFVAQGEITPEDAFEYGRIHGRRQVIHELAQEAVAD